MKTVILIFIAITLNAKILDVKQLFNFKSIAVKKEILQKSRTYYGKTAVDESKVKEIALRFDGFVTKVYADKSYTYIKKGDRLLKLYSKDIIICLK